MKTMMKAAVAAALIVASGLASVTAGHASAFYGWAVADVPAWDTLNVRAWPSAQSRILVAYPNGTLLSMTGKCTGGVKLGAIAGLPAWKQRQVVRSVWCETFVDPTGSGQYRTAWVFGKFIRPA